MVAPPHGVGIRDFDADYPIGRVIQNAAHGIHRALTLIPVVKG